MATGHDDDDDDEDDDDDADDAHVDDDDDHLRVACYPRAPVSYVTLGRPCHMLSQGGRVTCYPVGQIRGNVRPTAATRCSTGRGRRSVPSSALATASARAPTPGTTSSPTGNC